jgi:hypothetical protein
MKERSLFATRGSASVQAMFFGHLLALVRGSP